LKAEKHLLFEAWEELFETGLPSAGYSYIEAEKCFELFYQNGVREIWVPVVKSNV
jgi:predicted transcriptional regulator YdeE